MEPGLDRVNVTHEWGVLKETIVGIPDGLRLDMAGAADALRFMPEDAVRYLSPELSKKPIEVTNPALLERMQAQYGQLVDFLVARGVVVHRPQQVEGYERVSFSELNAGNMQGFPRDPILVIGNHIIETSLRAVLRNRERYGLREIIETIADTRPCHWVAMPLGRPVPVAEMPTAPSGPFLEGGDTFVLGNDILVGYNDRTATDPAGIEWLRRYLGDAYRVHAVRLSPDVLHLDDGLALVREGLALYCPEQFVDGVPPLLRDWELVEVDLRRALNLLAANCLVLGPGEVLLDERVPDIAGRLAAKDVTVHTIAYEAITWQGGGMRCSHHPIVRELP